MAACLMGLQVRIPPAAWMPVSCECCVLSGRGFCDGLMTCPEKSYRICVCVCVCIGVRGVSMAAYLMGLQVRIPPAAWTPVSCECCVLPGRGFCDEPMTRPEKSYRICVCVCVESDRAQQ